MRRVRNVNKRCNKVNRQSGGVESRDPSLHRSVASSRPPFFCHPPSPWHITTTAMSNTYQRLPTDETPANPTDLGRPIDDAREPDPSHRPLRAAVQAEFNRPPPSWWKRAALILSMVLMTWLTFKLGGMGNSKPKVIYATRFVSFLSSCSAFPSCLQPTHSPYPRLQIDVPFFSP